VDNTGCLIWSIEELLALRKNWLSKGRPELQKLLPGRSWSAIKTKAYLLGLGVRNVVKNEKIGFFDIEIYGSNFNAPFGIIICYCLKKENGEILERAITPYELYTKQFDKPLLQQLIKDLEQFDRIVVHYGGDRRFDVPYVRTRAVKFGLKFPEYKFQYLSDTWVILKNKFKLGSNRLGSACGFFGIESKQHPLNYDMWQLLLTGRRRYIEKAVRYILVHCREDVASSEKLWHKIKHFTKLGKTSI